MLTLPQPHQTCIVRLFWNQIEHLTINGEYGDLPWRTMRFSLDVIGWQWRHGGISELNPVPHVSIIMSSLSPPKKTVSYFLSKSLRNKSIYSRETVSFHGTRESKSNWNKFHWHGLDFILFVILETCIMVLN